MLFQQKFLECGLPLHALILHSLSWKRGPSQFFPPFAGAGLVQYRSRDRNAVLPQALGHEDHEVHNVKSPSTKITQKIRHMK